MEAIIASQFKLGKQLGNGAFGIIFEGTCIATDRKVAIKMVSS
jgi:serine/threonine protein kinase